MNASPTMALTGADGTAHLVTEDAMAAGRRAGRYAAVCGAEVIPASLTAAESACCRSCANRRARR